MKFFTKSEIKIIAIILFFLLFISSVNFQLALRRARDAQRKADLGEIRRALLVYQNDFGYFPPSNQKGEIVACYDGELEALEVPVDSLGNIDINKYFEQFRGCEWGVDGLRDITDPAHPPYDEKLPVDPKAFEDGYSYFYISNFNRFQLFAHLEGNESEDEYKIEIEKRGINCGSVVCNFGIAYSNTPLDMSIESYENNLVK